MTSLDYREKRFLTTPLVMRSAGIKVNVMCTFSRMIKLPSYGHIHFSLLQNTCRYIYYAKTDSSFPAFAQQRNKRHALLEQKVGSGFGFDMRSFQKPATNSDIFCCNFRFKDIHIVWLCFNWLAMSNTCYNPFIYGLLNVSSFYGYWNRFNCFTFWHNALSHYIYNGRDKNNISYIEKHYNHREKNQTKPNQNITTQK